MYELSGRKVVTEQAMLCVPEKGIPWHDTNFVMTRLISPVLDIIAIFCLFIVGVIYFVLPQLSDLTGNIITTLVFCLIFVQISDTLRTYDEFHNAMSYLVAGKKLVRIHVYSKDGWNYSGYTLICRFFGLCKQSR